MAHMQKLHGSSRVFPRLQHGVIRPSKRSYSDRAVPFSSA